VSCRKLNGGKIERQKKGSWGNKRNSAKKIEWAEKIVSSGKWGRESKR